MSATRSLPTGRLGRLARLAAVGARTGAGLLSRQGAGAAEYAAEVLGAMRGLAAKAGRGIDSRSRPVLGRSARRQTQEQDHQLNGAPSAV